MKKITNIKVLAVLTVTAMVVGLTFVSNSVKAGDHVGYKKVFLRNHCKPDPSYVCRLTDWPTIKM